MMAVSGAVINYLQAVIILYDLMALYSHSSMIVANLDADMPDADMSRCLRIRHANVFYGVLVC